MMNRWMGIVALGLMLSANASLVMRDLLPRWLAGNPPRSNALRLQPGQRIDTQYGIFNAEKRRIGYSWTQSSRNEDIISVQHRTVLLEGAIPLDVKLGSLRLDTNLIFRDSDQVDEIRVNVYGLGIPIRLEGEFFPPDDFACRWQIADQRGDFILPGRLTRSFGDVLRPFDSLTELTVGQSWRLELLNPLSGLLPEWGGSLMSTEGLYVRVARSEEIEHGGTRVETFVLEADRLRAWVNHKGRVLRQEFDLPLLGTMILIEEPYDQQLRQDELQRTFSQ